MFKKLITMMCLSFVALSAHSAVTKTFTYNLRDQVTSIVSDDDPSNPITFTYDGAGNRTSKTHNGVTTEFKWSPRGDLREVSRNGFWLARYRYDYQGLRISKQIQAIGKNVQETRYTYDGKHLLYETNVLGNVLVRYHWAQDMPTGETRNGENYYYMLDGMGSIVAVTAQNGSVVARIEYDAFGNVTRTQGSHVGIFGFTGFYADDETGLYYAQQRYYDSELGAFISEDPLEGVANDPPTQHRYLYARANPTKYVDKDGRCSSVVNMLDSTACDRHIAGFTDSKVLAQNIKDIKNEAAAYAGIGQAVGDIAVGTVQTAKDIGGTYVEIATGGKLAKGSMLRLRRQAEATYEFVTHPVASVQTAINNHNLIVQTMEAAGDFEGAIQERARFATTGLLTAVGAVKGGQIAYNKGKNFIQSHLPEPTKPTYVPIQDQIGIIGEGAGNQVVIHPMGNSVGTNQTSLGHFPQAITKINNQIPINSRHAGELFPMDKWKIELQQKYPNGVRFTQTGFPDFSSYVKANVKVDGLKGNTTTDFTAANKAAGIKGKIPGYTWHHHEDGRTMQLIPTDLHKAVRHTGGVAIINQRNKK